MLITVFQVYLEKCLLNNYNKLWFEFLESIANSLKSLRL